ncbi:unnamed protein product [Allacma fusca]|uniref:Uncharacterized protein n=1 Tax=Allacma fusca TaxID=39272 RepID=A0A8J2M720_9HEXA|nr:unnamed protein product [Allacma fusca]
MVDPYSAHSPHIGTLAPGTLETGLSRSKLYLSPIDSHRWPKELQLSLPFDDLVSPHVDGGKKRSPRKKKKKKKSLKTEERERETFSLTLGTLRVNIGAETYWSLNFMGS